MDQITLVGRQVDAGEMLLERLAEEGIEVTAAGWIKASDEETIYLYIASPIRDEEGPAPAYRRIHQVIRKMSSPWLDPFEVRLISPQDPIAEAIEAMHERHPSALPTRFGGASLGGLAIDWAYLYAPPKKSP